MKKMKDEFRRSVSKHPGEITKNIQLNIQEIKHLLTRKLKENQRDSDTKSNEIKEENVKEIKCVGDRE